MTRTGELACPCFLRCEKKIFGLTRPTAGSINDLGNHDTDLCNLVKKAGPGRPPDSDLFDFFPVGIVVFVRAASSTPNCLSVRINFFGVLCTQAEHGLGHRTLGESII